MFSPTCIATFQECSPQMEYTMCRCWRSMDIPVPTLHGWAHSWMLSTCLEVSAYWLSNLWCIHYYFHDVECGCIMAWLSVVNSAKKLKVDDKTFEFYVRQQVSNIRLQPYVEWIWDPFHWVVCPSFHPWTGFRIKCVLFNKNIKGMCSAKRTQDDIVYL